MDRRFSQPSIAGLAPRHSSRIRWFPSDREPPNSRLAPSCRSHGFGHHGPFRAGLWTGILPAAAMVMACSQAPADLREWRPSDHDRTDEPAGTRPGSARKPARAAESAGASAGSLDSLVDVTWRNQCSSCHGTSGRGDGPQGPLVRAPDLTRPDWQAQTSDRDMASVITGGRNRMPSFNLPPEVVTGLVKRIRFLQGHD